MGFNVHSNIWHLKKKKKKKKSRFQIHGKCKVWQLSLYKYNSKKFTYSKKNKKLYIIPRNLVKLICPVKWFIKFYGWDFDLRLFNSLSLLRHILFITWVHLFKYSIFNEFIHPYKRFFFLNYILPFRKILHHKCIWGGIRNSAERGRNPTGWGKWKKNRNFS